MWHKAVMAILIAAVTLSILGLVGRSEAVGQGQAKLRVGVYDSRAIAIAYAPSEYNPVAEMMGEMKKAKEAGDIERIKELEEWGPRHQRQLHRQGFGRVPVTDLLEHVKDRLPEVAKAAGVDVIAFECNYIGSDVEKIDITRELVMLFDPSDKVLGWVEQLGDHDPVDLDELENLGHDH